jgi:hypothetical protein
MAKIKAEVHPKKGIIQKLFYPLHIKLPIEAVAAALVVVLTIYIFKTMQPEMKLAQAPSEHETVIARSPSKVADEAISNEKIASPLARNDRTRLLLQEKSKGKEIHPSPPTNRRPLAKVTPPSLSLEKATPLSPFLEKTTPSLPPLEKTIPSSPPLEKGGKGGFDTEQTMPSKKPAPMDKLEEAPPPIQRQDKVRPSAGAVAKEEAKTEILSREAKAKVSDEKREIVNVTVLVKDIETARTKIETALTHLGGKIIKTESFENKEIVNAEINSQKYKEFIERLKSIGDVEEKEIDLKGRDGIFELIIEIK